MPLQNENSAEIFKSQLAKCIQGSKFKFHIRN